jgi:hypothetical protein
MASIVNAVLKATETSVDAQRFKFVAICCGVGLGISLIVATYGVDVSWGFF